MNFIKNYYKKYLFKKNYQMFNKHIKNNMFNKFF